MQTIAGAKKLKRMNKDKKMQDIEKAFNLIEAIDFSRFVEIMKGRTLSDLQFWFGDRVKELPNVNQIFEAKEQRRKGDKVLFEHSGNMPDMKFGLINALHKIAERLLFNEEHLNQIRTGNETFLNMPLIGQLWADSETLLKYRNVLLNWDSRSEKIKLFWAETFGEITPEQIGEIISKVYTEAKNETEQDYFLTFESVKYWLMREGRILPRDFNEFWDWFVISYSDNLDEGITQVTREHILKFCKETETKLTEPTVRTTSTNTSEQQEANSPAPETIVQRETTEQKIKRILEPLRGAFDDSSHIDTIIEAFIKQAYGDALPKGEKQILKHMKPNDFLKPFGELFSEGLLLRGIITETLLRYVKKNTYAGDPEYSQAYFNKLLSSYK